MNVEDFRGKSLKQLQALLLEEKRKLMGLPWEQQHSARFSALNRAYCHALKADERPVVEVCNEFARTYVVDAPRR